MLIGNAERVGVQFYTNNLGPGVSGGATINQIISPATNGNGLIIRTMSIIAHINGTNTATGVLVYADTSAPSTYFDTARRMIWHAASKALGTPVQIPVQSINYPLAIPAGYGVWITVAAGPGTDVGQATVLMTWDPITLS